jgi:tRNA pseudouridine55 synthase
VLPIALGPATRLASSPIWDVKLYWADVRFGSATDTDDAQGVTVAVGDTSALDLPMLQQALGGFIGTVSQRPPGYSAVHTGGQRAYALARRGETPVLPPRVVQIDAIEVVGWEPPMLSLRVQCRSGTYIRAIARDLGEAVGCPAHLAALVRLRVGPFTLDDALSYADLDAIAADGDWNRALWAEDLAARDRPALVLDEDGVRRFGWGQAREAQGAEGTARVYNAEGVFLGLASGAGDSWQPSIVFPSAAS